jgi:hypothetical protein
MDGPEQLLDLDDSVVLREQDLDVEAVAAAVALASSA